MKLIDLHVHSNASDGSCTPAEIVLEAEKMGLTAIALTDHDTVDGIDEAILTADSLNVEVIPGIELSCVWREKEIHILGLFINHHSSELLDFLESARNRRRTRNLEVLAALNKDGFNITLSDLLGGNEKTVITRAHFAQALLKNGYVTSAEQAFKKYLSPGCPYYRKKEEITPEEAMNALKAASAFPVLAHPCQYKFGWAALEELVSQLKAQGMKGLECYHSSNNQDESGKLRKLASRYRLCPTGGSDFHGAAKPDISLGYGRGNLRVSALFLDDIRLTMFLL